MKRKAAILCIMLTCLVLVGAMCGCKPTQQPAPLPPSTVSPPIPGEPTQPTQPAEETGPPELTETPVPVEYRTDTREKKAEQEGQPLLSIHLSVPVTDGLPGVSAYYQDWLNDQEYYATLEEDAARERYLEAQKTGSVFIPYTYESDFTVTRNDGVLLSVLRDFYENTGGSRPGYRLIAETFVVGDDALLVLGDLFIATDYRDRLRDEVLALLPDKIAEMGTDPYYANLDETLMDVYNPRDFYLTDSALTLFWQSADIAPAIAGVQEFEIPLERLSDILDPRWLP